jgi:hypothetical protein
MSPTGGEVKFGVVFTEKNMAAILASVKKLKAGIRGSGEEVKKTTRNTHELGRSFRNIALRTIAYLGVVRGFSAITGAFRNAINAGLEYNETIEQSRLAIASLITAQADLYDETGRQLQGVEALDAAYVAATDQVRKLRVAGIQTAATTKELVDAFQQAVGAGLATGLTLDEIRTVTIRIAQAAGALGVPYRQLNEEIRSILGGIIDQNTRIAKSLQITNDQVRLAKEQGRLAEFLVERFEAFGIAGERIVETWAALKSNVKEVFELFAGEVTFPMFEAVRQRGLGAVQRIFDFDTAEISKEFSTLVKTISNVFAGVGDQIAGSFEGALNSAVNLNYWMEQNREAVNSLIFNVGELSRGFAEMVGGVAKIGLGIQKWGVEGGHAQNIIESIADTMKVIGRQPVLSGGLFALGGLGTFYVINAVLGQTAVIVASVVAGLVVLTTTIDRFVDSQAEAVLAMTRASEEQTNATVGMDRQAGQAQELAREYGLLTNALENNEVKTDKVVAAQNRLKGILNQLYDLHPDYRKAVEETTGSEEDYVKAIDGVIDAQIRRVENQIAANRTLMQLAQEDLDEILTTGAEAEFKKKSRLGAFLTSLPNYLAQIGDDNTITELNNQLSELAENIKKQEAELNALRERRLGRDYKILGRGGDEGDGTEARAADIETQIARIQNRLQLREAELKDQFERNVISYLDYYDLLNQAQNEAITLQIALRRQLQQVYGDDPKKAGREDIQILQLETQLQIKLIQNELARRQEQIKFAREAEKIQVGALKAIGDAAEATRLRLLEQHREYREGLEAMSRSINETVARDAKAALAELDEFIGLEVAREQLNLYEESLQRAQNSTRNAVQEIEQLREVGAISQTEAQDRMATEYEGLLATMRQLLPLMREQAVQLGDPDALANVQAIEAEMAKLELTVGRLRDHWAEFREAAGQAAAQELANYMSSAVIEAENLGQAFTNLVGSLEAVRNLLGRIAQQMLELVARAVALQIVNAGFKALGFPQLAGARSGGFVSPDSIAGPILRRAGGGTVIGPGTSTSDSILARLSAGEYVVNAASVRKYGTDFFHRLNAGAMPKEIANLKRYATGGVVGGGGTPVQTTKDFRGELTIGLADGLVLDQMNTPDGERLVLKVINKNRRGILRSLGI